MGLVNVNGISIENSVKRIKDKMAGSGYASLNNGTSQLQVSISKIRSIKVTVIGDARKVGTYTLSSLSTLFNALYACGGPNEKGSLRPSQAKSVLCNTQQVKNMLSIISLL